MSLDFHEAVMNALRWREANLERLLRACVERHGIMLRLECQQDSNASEEHPHRVFAGSTPVAAWWIAWDREKPELQFHTQWL